MHHYEVERTGDERGYHVYRYLGNSRNGWEVAQYRSKTVAQEVAKFLNDRAGDET